MVNVGALLHCGYHQLTINRHLPFCWEVKRRGHGWRVTLLDLYTEGGCRPNREGRASVRLRVWLGLPPMDRLLGLLKVKIVRGVNLAVRDCGTSDPYLVLKMDNHKLKTHVIKKNVNPQWNEELTLSVVDPTHPIKLEVYDKDTFSFDDPMGDAEIDIKPFIEAVKLPLQDIPNKTIIKKLIPSRSNCLAEESPIYIFDGKVLQDIVLRLRHVETGEVEIQLQWVSVPNSRGP